MPSEFTVSRYQVDVSTLTTSITAESYIPSAMRALLTLAHGAGANLDHAFLKKLASMLAEAGVGVIRYNFIYTEQGKRMPDRFPVASEVIKAIVADAKVRFPDVPLFLGGKSFGGRMSSMTVAEYPDLNVRGLVFFGFPLHPAGTPSVDRAVHLSQVHIPMLFLQGTKDTLAYKDLIEEVTSKLPSSALIFLEGYDHSFNRGKQSGLDELVAHTLQWLDKN